MSLSMLLIFSFALCALSFLIPTLILPMPICIPSHVIADPEIIKRIIIMLCFPVHRIEGVALNMLIMMVRTSSNPLNARKLRAVPVVMSMPDVILVLVDSFMFVYPPICLS